MTTAYDIRDHGFVAKRTYECIWCGQDIVLGEKIRLHQYRMDEDPPKKLRADYFHDECWTACMRYFWNAWDDRFTAHIHKRGSTELQDGKHEDE